MTDTLHCEPIKLELVGLDGNAFSLMGAFQRAARKQGRTKDEIDAVLKDSMSGDYSHLICTLSQHCK
jgi:hypothetical protein